MHDAHDERSVLSGGEERNAKKNKTYVTATLRRNHLMVDGDTAIFEYIGKRGQEQRKAVTDVTAQAGSRRVPRPARLRALQVLRRGRKVHNVKSRDLNTDVMGVVRPEFIAKNFRTSTGP